jgi:hypothetical protein
LIGTAAVNDSTNNLLKVSVIAGMDTSVKRVTKDRLQNEVEDSVVAGWKLKSQNENVAILKKSGDFGSAGIHLIIAFLTIWWTFGLGNILYSTYTYLAHAQELQIKAE